MELFAQQKSTVQPGIQREFGPKGGGHSRQQLGESEKLEDIGGSSHSKYGKPVESFKQGKNGIWFIYRLWLWLLGEK